MKPNTITTIASKWRGLRNWTMLASLLPLFTVTCQVRAQVTNIIYEDNFARTGQLDGTAPDTVNTSGAKWFACNNPGLNAQLQTDGASIALTNVPGTTNGIYLNGFLPFVPQVGHLYILSANISSLSGGNQWLAMGFATHALTNNYFATYKCGSGWVLVRGNGTGFSTWGALTGSSSFTTAFGTTTNLFAVTLDTTTGNADYQWSIKFYTNGVLVPGGNYTIPYGNYPIKYVGIGADAGQGYFQNFTLTDVLERQGAPTIIEQPQNTTAQVGQTATFWAAVTNDYPAAAYQWMTNSTGGPTNAIAGATNAFYATPALDMSYNGLNYSVTITNANGSTNSATAALAVVSGPPTVYSVTKTPSVTNLVVAFSKAVDPATGLNPANYSVTINGAPSGISIVSASYGSTSNNVILMTSTLNTNTGYYLNVQNVQDLFGNAMSASTNVVLPAGLVFYVRADSGVVYDSSGSLVAQWLDQTTNGNNASQFFGVPTAGPNYVGSVVRPTTSSFNNGQLALDFGTTIHWLAAPSTPSLESMISNTTMYAVARFTAASDELVNKNWGNLPAPFDWDPSPQSENIQYGNGGNNAPANGTGSTVLLNTPYVLSSMLTFPVSGGTTNFNFWLNGAPNGNGALRGLTDNPPFIGDAGFPLWIGARWDLVNPRMRGQIAEILLFKTALSGADLTNVDNYLGQKYFAFTIAQDLPASTTSSNGFAVTYTFLANQGSVHGFSFQWQENGTNLPGVNSSTYTTPILSPSDNGDTFDVAVTSPDGSTIYSVTNTLTVLNVAPTVAWAGLPIWDATNQIVVLFDEAAMDPTTATAVTNYSLSNGANVLSAVMGDAPNKVVLATTPISWNANLGDYTLTVSNVMDLYNNTMAPVSLPLGLYPPNVVLWLKAKTGVITDAGANTVNEWDDQSGNGNNFIQPGGPVLEPQQITNVWGDVVLRFTNTPTGGSPGSNYLYNSGSSTLGITGDMSFFAAVNFQPQTGRNGSLISKDGLITGTKNLAAPYDIYMGTAGTLFYRGNGSTYGQTTGTLGPGAGYPCVLAVSETGNTVSQYFDNQAAGTGSLNNGYQEANDFDAGNLTFIGYRADSFNSLTGDLAEMIVTASSTSSSDVAALDNYLSTQHHFVLFNPNRTNIVVTLANSQMKLTWPADHTGWQLQSNSVGLTATGAWSTVSGSTLTNQILVTPSAGSSNVFYRLFYQQP